MEKFPGNSNAEKEAKAKKIISGTAKVKEKSLTEKFKEVFFAEAEKDLKDYILFDVILPTVKDTLFSTITDSLSMVLFGTAKSRNKNTGSTIISYNKISASPYTRPSVSRNPFGGSRVPEKDFIFETRQEADSVLDGMLEYISQYGTVTLADLKAMIGVTTDFTDNKWGWDNLSQSSIRRIREGYILVLPNIKPI